MLFHDFRRKPQNLDFVHVRGDMDCQWKNQSLVIDFTDELFTWFLFHKPVHGYEGIQIESGFTVPGQLKIQIVDVFGRSFEWGKSIDTGVNTLKIPWTDFHGSSDNCLATMEKMKVYFVPETKGKQQWTIKSIMPYGIRHYEGPWISVDPLFPYYHHSTWEETANRIKNLGFVGVEVVNIEEEPTVEKQKEIVRAFRNEGLLCVLRIYPTTDFPAYHKHPDWRQKSLDGTSGHDWRVYLCPNSREFREYVADKIAHRVKEAEYDALELSEPWFEVWGGPYGDNPQKGKYGCVCPHCIARFKERTGVDARRLFEPDSSCYFQKKENAHLYEQWMQMRVDSIIDFCEEIYDAAKKVSPDISIIHMHLSDCRVEPERGREYHAQDLQKALKVLQPDAVIIQDAWQDWTIPDLAPDFAVEYGEYYIPRIEKIDPEIKVLCHADIGSLEEMQRSYTWMRQFIAFATETGFSGVDFYEFTIGDYYM